MTPRMFNAIVRAKRRKDADDFDGQVCIAHINAVLQRSKKIPKLNDILPSRQKPNSKKRNPEYLEKMMMDFVSRNNKLFKE